MVSLMFALPGALAYGFADFSGGLATRPALRLPLLGPLAILGHELSPSIRAREGLHQRVSLCAV